MSPSNVHRPRVREIPTSGLNDQRFVPRLIYRVGIVLTDGRPHAQADADDRRRAIFGKLLERHRRSAVQIDRDASRQIAEPRPGRLLELARAPALRHDPTTNGTPTPTLAKRPAMFRVRPNPDRRHPDTRARVLNGQRRVECDGALAENRGHGQDVDPCRRGRVSAGHQVLGIVPPWRTMPNMASSARSAHCRTNSLTRRASLTGRTRGKRCARRRPQLSPRVEMLV